MFGPWISLLACAPTTLDVRVTPDGSGVSAEGTLPLDRVELRDGTGRLRASRTLDPPARTTSLRVGLTPGAYELRALAGDQAVQRALIVADPGPFDVRFEAPLGQDAVPEGTPVDVPRGGTLQAGLVVTARVDGPIAWSVGAEDGVLPLVAGERGVIPVRVGQSPLTVTLTHPDGARTLQITPRLVDPNLQLADLRAGPPEVPAHPDGSVDRTVPAGRIALPAPWWDAVLDRFGLGFRARDDLAPRTHLALPITNPGDRALNLAVNLRILDAEGQPHPAFRPRLRDADAGDTVRRLIRVEPGQTERVALPVYLDRRALPDTVGVTAELTLRPLGSETARTVRGPLVVDRGTPWASATLGLASLAMIVGWTFMIAGLPAVLRRPIRELTTVAMFASLAFTVGVASQVLGLGLGSVLGPFAPFVLGLVDDAVRMCLLGTLLARVPRPGTFALATGVGWLMRALALGAIHPVDALYLGATIGLTEAALWLAGVTRTPWTQGSPAVRWVRLTVGLAVPNAAAVGISLAVSVVLYRLYVAEWYAIALILGPGLIYAAVGCAFAVPFSDALRRVG